MSVITNGIRFVEYMTINDIYIVQVLGNTSSGDWISAGACIGNQPFPDIGRRFKCLDNTVSGTGIVQDYEININNVIQPISGEVDVNIISSIVLPVNNTQENALYIQADNTHAINVIADVDHPVNVKADTTHPLYINNTQAQAVFIQADNTHAINVIADENHPVNVKADITHPLYVNNTQEQAVFIQADNTHAINVIADEDHPVNVKADITRPLYVNNTQAQALFIQADSNIPVDIKASVVLPISGTVDIGNYPASVNVIGTVAVSTLPPIAITNTSFNSNITNAFLTVKNKPTYSVSLEGLSTTAQTIRSSAGVLHTIIITSVEQPIVSGSIEFIKLYNASSATELSTPLCTVGVASGQTLTFVADMNFSGGLCVRATNKFLINDTTPTNCIFTMTCFITGYSE